MSPYIAQIKDYKQVKIFDKALVKSSIMVLDKQRQQEILRIIEEQDIDTQDQLLAELRARGLQSTQATISRDIKELRLVKELTGQGKYRYAATDRKSSAGTDTRLRNIFKEGVVRAQGVAECRQPAAHDFQGGGHLL